ncbi:MAG: BTAD domain-containing putative transcriptional regulator [Eubacteriales bacterium]
MNQYYNNTLKIKTFDRFEISEKDRVLDISNHASQLISLFKYLLINENKFKSVDSVLDDLYRDREYENPKNAVQNMIYRLKKYLKENEVFDENTINFTYSNESYKLSLTDVYVDFRDFEDKIKKAKGEKDLESKIARYEEAVEVYKGEFLPELLYEDWIIPTRSHLSRSYVDAVNNLLSYYKKENMLEKGIFLGEKAIKIEPFEEEIHINYIDILISKDRIRDAKKHYEYITTLLYNQFGIRPNENLQKIYNKVKEKTKLETGSSQKVKYLWEESKDKGAFYCSYSEFYPIYVLEKRRSERDSRELNPVLIKFTDLKNPLSKDQKDRIIKIFVNSLRKGDVLCKWENNGILVLLPDLEFEKVKFVVNRVSNRIKSYKEFKNIDIIIDENIILEKKNSLPLR